MSTQQILEVKYNINSKFILFVGRFSKSKGIETLIHAFNIINNNKINFPDIHLDNNGSRFWI